MAGNLFTLPRVTVLALLQVAFIRSYLGSHHVSILPTSLLPLTILVLAANYTFMIFWASFIHPFFFHPLRNFPAPKDVIISRLWTRIRSKSPPGQLLLQIAERTPNDGIIVMQGQAMGLLVTKPQAFADILVHHPYDFAKFETVRKFLRPILGDGLVIVEGDRHKFLRKNTQPAFKYGHIKELYPVMWEKAVALSDLLSEKVRSGDSEIEMGAWAGKVTLDVIGIAAFGRELHVLRNPDNPLVKNYTDLLAPGGAKTAYFFLTLFFPRSLIDLLPWKVSRMFNETTANIRAICAQFVRDKKEAVAKNADDNFDILSLLIKSNNFSESEMVDQLLTFLTAGHETTSSAFTWATYLLAVNKDMQSTLRAEIRQALPNYPQFDEDRDMVSVLEHLPYLNGIINETLRLYPTVPMTVRVAVRDTTVMGIPVEKGTEFMLSPWLANRYTALWGPDATEFRPERWMDGTEDGTKKVNNTGGVASNYAQMTFLHGPRSCIGQGFAKAEMRCLLASFVSSFSWDLAMEEKDVIPGGVITIKPANGLHLRLTRVK